LPDGEEGELVFTSLTKEAFPVIRYRTRDLTRLLPPTARSMRRMDKITGRSDDMLIIRGVNLFPTQVEEMILRNPELAPHYQLIITREAHLDALEILVEMREPAWVASTDAQRDAAANALQHHVKAYIGVSATVRVVAPNAIERTAVGKARRVVDQRKRQTV
jgi:phenylacetate-CoA ligase